MLSKEYLAVCTEVVDALKKRYSTRSCKGAVERTLRKVPDGFYFFQPNEQITVIQALKLSRGSSYVLYCLFVWDATVESVGSRGRIHRTHYTEPYQFAVAQLEPDFGRAIIRPETMADKLVELFERRELDFPQCPDFSRKYFFLAEDEDKARAAASPAFLNEVAGHEGLTLFLTDNEMLATRKKVVSHESCSELVEFAFDAQGAARSNKRV